MGHLSILQRTNWKGWGVLAKRPNHLGGMVREGPHHSRMAITIRFVSVV